MQKTLHGWQGVQQEIVLLLTQSQKLAWGDHGDHSQVCDHVTQHSFDDMQCIWYLEEYLGNMGIGVGLPAGGTLMFGWKKLAEAVIDALEEDCVEMDGFWWEADGWDWLFWEEFSCCKAFNLGEQEAVWEELELVKKTAWVPASLVVTSPLDGPLFRSSPNRFTILNGLSNLDTKYDLPS